MIVSKRNHLVQNLFTRLLSLTYFFAFATSFVQFQGLHGRDGISPLPRSADAFTRFAREVLGIEGIDTYDVADLIHIIGMLCSLLNFFSTGLDFTTSPSVAQLAVLPYLYHEIVSRSRATDGPFYNFQWENLLIEAGVVGCLWGSHRLLADEEEDLGLQPSRAANYAIRFLLFKLMYSSGVVKLTSRDPTWWDLRALNYHFASQPLPTSLAWYAASYSPDWLLRLSTAGSIFIEIPMALLILSPFSFDRLLAFAAVINLMIAIALTGNYNFFNLLTSVLAIALWFSPFRTRGEGRLERWGRLAQITATCAFLAWRFNVMFELVSNPTAREFPLRLRKKSYDVQREIEWVVPLSCGFALAVVGVCTVVDTLEAFRYALGARDVPIKLALGFLSLVMVMMMSIPFVWSLDPNGFHAVVPSAAIAYFAPVSSLFHSYGLFRSMTGVNVRTGEVEVPTILMEYRLEENDPRWLPLEFKYYPSDATVSLPVFVAPHKPMLDWQMWFAALGGNSGRAGPWFKSFCRALLGGSENVWKLVRTPRPSRGIFALRAKLVDFRFAAPGTAKEPVWEIVPNEKHRRGVRFMEEMRRESWKGGGDDDKAWLDRHLSIAREQLPLALFFAFVVVYGSALVAARAFPHLRSEGGRSMGS